MSINQTHNVDDDLALVPVTVLMTKAFELTHRLHTLGEEREKARGMAEYEQAHNARAEARAQRDVIIREMERRSDAMERALVGVETAERIMRVADEALHDRTAGSDARRVAMARTALDMGMERTTTTTCSLVKQQTLSDRISAKARQQVKGVQQAVREIKELPL